MSNSERRNIFLLRAIMTFLVISFQFSSYAETTCGEDYNKCNSFLKKAEKLIKELPYDEKKSYDDSYPINHMYKYDDIITTFSKKVPRDFKEGNKDLRLALRAWEFYNTLLPIDFFSIAPFKRLWCKDGKIQDEKILKVADSVFSNRSAMKKKFREAIKECGSCKNTKMCEGP